MDIKTLKNFITIAENGSICKAAKELHMSQPPLSKQIKLLEDELNVQLFDRSTRGVELTNEGRLLYTLSLIHICLSIFGYFFLRIGTAKITRAL